MARAMLGEWAEAAKDLHLASTIDYDEEISAVLKKVLILVLNFINNAFSVSFLLLTFLKFIRLSRMLISLRSIVGSTTD